MRVPAVLACLLLAAGCSSGETFAVVTVRSAGGDLAYVAQFQVQITETPAGGPERKDTLYYPRSPGGPYRISATDSIDFSVSFSADDPGTLKIGVAPRDSQGASLGYGETETDLDPDADLALEVRVMRDVLPPEIDTFAAGLP